jgi:hypothetical protein
MLAPVNIGFQQKYKNNEAFKIKERKNQKKPPVR